MMAEHHIDINDDVLFRSLSLELLGIWVHDQGMNVRRERTYLYILSRVLRYIIRSGVSTTTTNTYLLLVPVYFRL